MTRPSGQWRSRNVGGEVVRAFIPAPLPPEGLDVSGMQGLLDRANRALGGLDVASALLPDPTLFVYMYVRKEAVVSSQIEGTQSSLSDLLAHEVDGTPAPLDDVAEVSSYVAAMDHGLRRLRVDGFPLSLRLIREVHAILLRDGRGREKRPGEFRTSQNWIGGTRPGNAVYVPPPPDELLDHLAAFERFLHDDPVRVPLVVKVALAHAQFETIHPFLDGNGRVGRLLVTLMLCAEGAMREPLLYLSLYFKRHRDQYYELLQQVRTAGDWGAWLMFFAEGVVETSEQAVETARQAVTLFASDREKLRELGRSSHSALTVHEVLQRQPVTTVAAVMKATGLSDQGAANVLARLVDAGVLQVMPVPGRARWYAYRTYLDILATGTDPLPR